MSVLVTLTTDFGTRDSYVAQLKGAILSRAPGAVLIDVTHEIAPHDIAAAALVLGDLPCAFPAGTIHLAVVDPGVGSARRLVAFEAAGQRFVGPDNGLWSAVLRKYPAERVHEIDNRALWNAEVSPTFHGRDVMAPVVAHLVTGGALSDVGSLTSRPLVDRSGPAPRIGPRRASGHIAAIDRFGNAVTSLPVSLLDREWNEPRSNWMVTIGQVRIEGLHTCYADVAPGELVAIVSSQGDLEIAVCEGNAADELGLAPGHPVSVEPGGHAR